MIDVLKKFWIPLVVLTITGVTLLMSFRPREEKRLSRGQTQQDRVDAGDAVLRILSERKAQLSPKEFVRMAEKELQDKTLLTAAGWQAAGEEFFQSGMIGLAEHCLRNAVACDAESTAGFRLARILYITGRVDDARKIFVNRLKTSGIDVLNLPLLGNAGLKWQDDADVVSKAPPEDADRETLLAKAWMEIERQQLESALAILGSDELNSADSLQVTVTLLRCICLSRLGRSDDLAEVFSRQSAEVLSSAEILCLQGELCRRESDEGAAIRCYWEAFKRSPNLYVASAQLAELLEIQKLPDLAALFRERSLVIRDYEDVCRQIHAASFPSEQQLGFAAYSARNLHCLRESLAWSVIARQAYPDAAWSAELTAHCLERIGPADDRFSSLQEWIDFQDVTLRRFRLPEWRGSGIQHQAKPSSRQTILVFDDDAERCGIDFQFEDAADPNDVQTRLFEFTGGGVSAVDFDQDSWPDLFLTQGGAAPLLGHPDPDQENRVSNRSRELHESDQLYRNRRGITFDLVTPESGLYDGGYSQGCASGDIDNDGFADLLIANIGENQLFRNNGDGTFSAVTLPRSNRWTTSCAIADLTGDGQPDLYEVNHVIPSGIHQKMCRRDGVSVPCTGTAGLSAEQDHLFAGDGHGGFSDVTSDSGITADDGLGLGLCVFRLGDQPSLSVFVANDARKNFLFVNQGTAAVPQFREEALIRGLALSGAGKAQACMGIAAGDVDHNGATDFLVTNFFADYNTLYYQEPAGFFQDGSSSANLIESSYSKLGFGSQFLDADLDGDLDLVVANGDVADFSTQNSSRPYEQRPQVFVNDSGRGFHEQSGELAGTAFQQPRLGRGLARLDWNRDGLADFVVSNIRSPVLLASNRTRTEGGFLSLRLIGTMSPRIPVGTIVRISEGERTQHHQLMAGDGYQCSNENCLLIGIGGQTFPVKGSISWPSGNVQTFIATSARMVIVEGSRSVSLTLRD